MAAETESANAAAPIGGVARVKALPAHMRTRPLLSAYAALLVTVAALAGAIGVAGSASDGDPSVTLKLRGFPSQKDAELMRPGAFRGARELRGNLVADPDLMEDSPQGPLPRIARGGRTPMLAYARKYDGADKRPKIALVIRGLGIGAANTELALTQLPADVTLAFTPFSPELQGSTDQAREQGHEVLLEIPMEPFDFPESDPGPHLLLAAASAEENIKRLDWALSRATGYVGVMNLLGGRFLGESGAIEPVLGHLAKRGVLFFDNGMSSNSVTTTSARHVRATMATASLTLDTVQTPAAIDTKLADLEAAARQDGFAIGVASAYPVSIARVSEWLANAQARGFHPVPLTAVAAQPQLGVAKSE
jgi:polysaccharide deacetylase 2 family uncharacterized protein YibQ